jgi:hypothetical protein
VREREREREREERMHQVFWNWEALVKELVYVHFATKI